MKQNNLAGCGILITRPRQQAATLAELVETQGGTPVIFPLLEIAALQDAPAFDAKVADLAGYNWAFFISSNAVQFGMKRLVELGQTFPASLKCAAIGPATAQELRSLGVAQVLTPQQRYDSEHLLACPELQDMQGQRCLIFRGEGGRELLAEKLRERGATVDLAECYRRINPSADLSEPTRLWQNGQLHAIVVTSSEALRNLLDMAKQASESSADWLKQTPLFVNHVRIAEYAASQGWQAITAEQPGDAGMLAALMQWWKP